MPTESSVSSVPTKSKKVAPEGFGVPIGKNRHDSDDR